MACDVSSPGARPCSRRSATRPGKIVPVARPARSGASLRWRRENASVRCCPTHRARARRLGPRLVGRRTRVSSAGTADPTRGSGFAGGSSGGNPPGSTHVSLPLRMHLTPRSEPPARRSSATSGQSIEPASAPVTLACFAPPTVSDSLDTPENNAVDGTGRRDAAHGAPRLPQLDFLARRPLTRLAQLTAPIQIAQSGLQAARQSTTRAVRKAAAFSGHVRHPHSQRPLPWRTRRPGRVQPASADTIRGRARRRPVGRRRACDMPPFGLNHAGTV